MAAAAVVSADDWPQWRGPERLAVWQETGIVDQLPEQLQVAWRTPLRAGYSGPAVADGRVFITDWAEDPDSRTLDGTERALALDEQSGEVLWTHEWHTSYRMLSVAYAIGPRATPTVDGDRVYIVGATGRLFCFNVETGRRPLAEGLRRGVRHERAHVWGSRQFTPRRRRPSHHGRGRRAGRARGGIQQAHRRGDLARHRGHGTEMGYAQPIIYEAGRRPATDHLAPAGARLARSRRRASSTGSSRGTSSMGLTVATPVRSGDYLLVSQLFNGSMMVRLSQDRPAATHLWQGQSRSELPGETDTIHAMVTTPVVVGDYVYGLDSYGELRALDARDGAADLDESRPGRRRRAGAPRSWCATRTATSSTTTTET